MKYIVMECHLSYAVVLDEKGRFLKVANKNYQVGQTVTEIIEMHIPEAARPQKQLSRRFYSAAAIAACLLLAVTVLFFTDQVAYASVYLHINPEIRIDVNKKDLVVGLSGVNTDGKALIDGYSYRNKSLSLVMDELIDRSIDLHFLHEGGTISLTLDSDHQEWLTENRTSLASGLQKHLDEKLSVTIDVTSKQEALYEHQLRETENESEDSDPEPDSNAPSSASDSDNEKDTDNDADEEDDDPEENPDDSEAENNDSDSGYEDENDREEDDRSDSESDTDDKEDNNDDRDEDDPA